MGKKRANTTQSVEAAKMHPQHESWIAITTLSTLVGSAVLIALIALLIVVIDLHFNLASLVFLGALIAVILCIFVWRSTPLRRRGVLGNAELTMRVNMALNAKLDLTNVNVDSSRGVVTLRGTCTSAKVREEAEIVARRMGARRVVNELQVDSPGVTPPDSYFDDMPVVTTPEGAPEVVGHGLEQAVREALEDDKRVNAYLLRIRVENSVAILMGRQDTVQASDAATEDALRVPGVLGVNNDIEIEPSA